MEEIWKDIPNYEGYQVSNLGRVRTHNKTTYTERHGVRNWKDRILKYKGETYNTGYRVDLWKDGKCNTFLVARLVAFTFYNEDINNHKLTVDHVDGNRFNNNINNLELVSLAENIRRAFKTGLMPYNKIKLTDKDSDEELMFNSMSQASLYMKKNHGYISAKCKQNIFEDNKYKWEIIK